MRVLLFCERLAPPFDEGIKNTALNLIRALSQAHEVLALTTLGQDVPQEGITDIPTNRLLLNPALFSSIRRFRPELVLYIPTASATPAAMWRMRLLGFFARGAQAALLATQQRQYSTWGQRFARRLRPPLVLAQSAALAEPLEALGMRVERIGAAVDAERFRPAPADKRRRIRAKYALDADGPVMLHVGHINRGRNVQAMARLREAGWQPLLVGSASTEQDEELARELIQAGVRVLRAYVPNVEELYQAADCFIFPVLSVTGAIEMPLSVLEAMACNLPVITTDYGPLQQMFGGTQGMYFAGTDDEMVAQAQAVRRDPAAATRAGVLPLTWERLAAQIIETVAKKP